MFTTQSEKEINAIAANRAAAAEATRHIEMAARRIHDLKEKKRRKEQLARLNQFMTTLNH
jgi:hypothetical protein